MCCFDKCVGGAFFDIQSMCVSIHIYIYICYVWHLYSVSQEIGTMNG